MIKRINIEPGTVIRGRWYGGEYRVIALLGSGGTARVYLVEDIPGGDRYALKLSTDMAGIDREYRILARLGPYGQYTGGLCTGRLQGRRHKLLLL